jgi:arsenate reductase (thioredoxin)
MTETNILVLCTGNSARSILGEALFNRLGEGRVAAFSAGSRPAGAVNPGALRLLAREGYECDSFRSKNWAEFTGPVAPEIDIVLTVCGNAAGEACPVFPGTPVRGHWGLADPAAEEGSVADVDSAFERTYALLRSRIEALLALPFETMSRAALQEQLAVIGAMEGAA